MTPNRFPEAKRIYNSALECEPAQRAAFLAEACGADESLRKEVESLLGCRTEAQEFFKAPAVQAGGEAAPRIDFTGRALSHFEIVEKMGEGGMGVVYKARDTHLDRLVALKILPPEKVADLERKRRFVQEAKAASALSHPNIVTIHEIDTAGGATFIAMEFVKGRTLDRLIRGKGLGLNETLKLGVQLAGALMAAHAAGIIHRDIKPANIMVTDTGVVKVLDFGLAKLSDGPEKIEAGKKRQTTEPGVILGTVAYMSPEQAQGREVDTRSDIFSLGSVLYEMTTGTRAFSGETNASTLASILREEPKPVSQLAPETPRELERVVNRCLRKRPERRFQDMADLKVALEELKEESDSGALAPSASTRHRRGLVRILGACLVAATLGLGAWFGLLRRPPAGPAPKVRTFTGLPGKETRPAFSPGGNQLAFAWNGEQQDNFDIYVQRVDGTTPRRLTFDPAFDYSPVWSPDGLDIAFLRDSPAGTEIIRIPEAGGAERKLYVSPVRMGAVRMGDWSGLAWSPNGKFLAIMDQDPKQASSSIFLLDLQTHEKQKLTTPPSGCWDGLPAFSPDGGSLAFTRGHDRPLSDIYVLRLSDSGQPRGEPLRVTRDNTFIYGLDWTSDGRSIVFSSTRGGVWALWRVSASGEKEPERLPVGGDNAFYPSVSRRENRLAYAEGVDDWNVWRVAAPGGATEDPAAAPVRISPSQQINEDPSFSPDGRMIVWSSMHSGSHQIWLCHSDGSQPNQLTGLDPPGAAEPRWSHDGTQIAFNGYSGGPHSVYVIRAGGGAAHRLTSGNFNEDVLNWSHDGQWVYFGSNRGDQYALWKAPLGRGSPVLVARNARGAGDSLEGRFVHYSRPQAVESSDGRFVYYSGSQASIWRVPASGGSPVLVARNGSGPVESFDGKFVYYSGPEHNIWRLPAAGGEPARVLKTGPQASWTLASAGIYVLDPDAKGGPSIGFFPFSGERAQLVRLPGQPNSYLSGVSVSPDGRWILYIRVDRAEADIMLVDNFR